jgi:hypothetical protein
VKARMKGRGGISSAAVLCALLGCSGTSRTAFSDPPGSGGVNASGGSGAAGGSSASGGSGGQGASGGDAASSGGSSAGSGGSGAESGLGGAAGGGAISGSAGAPSAGMSGSAGAGSSGAAGTGGFVEPGPLSGTWAMFWWEDPVVVQFTQSDERLMGRGCCAGLGPDPVFACCGAVTGTCSDGRASFEFALEDFGEMSPLYGTDVYVSEDYQRMGGKFGVDGNRSYGVAWVRLDPRLPGLGGAPSPLRETLAKLEGRFQLMLSSELVDRFEPLVPYDLVLGGTGFIRGAFGPFYWEDMTWDGDAQTLTAGPVPETDPSFATKLELRFDGVTLESVVATYPNESPYFFAVVAPK